MTDFLKLIGQEAPYERLVIVTLSLISGVAGGIIVPLTLYGAQDIVAGVHYVRYLIGLPVLAFMLVLSKRMAQQRTAQLTETTLEQLLLRITNYVRHAELPEIERLRQSELFLTLTQTRDITQAATKSLNVLQSLISLTLGWGYILWLSPQAAFILLVALAIALAMHTFFQRLTHDALREEAATEKALFDTFHHLLEGFKELKLNRQKSHDIFNHYLRPLVEANQNVRTRAAFYFSDYHVFTDVCAYLAMGGIAFFLASQESPEMVILMFAILFYNSKLVLVLLAQLPDIARGQIALQQFQQTAAELLTSAPVVADLYTPTNEIKTTFQTIVLEHVHFQYPASHDGRAFSVGPIHLTITAGEILFIIGGNGGGKTTLMKLLTGLYHPSAGMFRVDRERRTTMGDYRYFFATVFSDVHLFDRLYGVECVEPQRVQALLHEMELDHKIRWEDGRFSTLNLSRGQKKRLALVTALLEDKPIYVFDEWAADQAPYFRQYFYTQVLPALKAQGKTIIAVSHDERYFGVADRIVKMEDGLLIEG